MRFTAYVKVLVPLASSIFIFPTVMTRKHGYGFGRDLESEKCGERKIQTKQKNLHLFLPEASFGDFRYVYNCTPSYFTFECLSYSCFEMIVFSSDVKDHLHGCFDKFRFGCTLS